MAWSRVASGFLLLAVLGCGPSGPKMYDITGTITFDGKPVTSGEIVFSPVNAGHSADGSPIGPDGSYRARVKEGEHVVRIIGLEMRKPSPAAVAAGDESGESAHSYVPEKYNAKSELRADVTEAKRIDFDLKSR